MSYADFLSEFVDRDEPHTQAATDAAAILVDLAREEPWAHSRVADFVRAKLVVEIKEARKARNTLSYTDSGGRKRRITTAVSLPVRDESTGDVVDFQMFIEWDMDAVQLNNVLSRMQSESREVRDRINVVRELLAVLERHPECRTAREAWTAEGRSLDEIDLSA